METLEKISRRLSKLLRHDPHPLTMTDAGWMDSISLIDHLGITFEQLEEMVATNDKQRFSFNEDKSMIRANQGHSKGIAEDKEYARITALQVEMLLYHGTDNKTADLIKKDKILPGKRQFVHWSPDIEVAKKRANQRAYYEKSVATIITLKARNYIHSGGKLLLAENNVYLTPEINGNILEYIFIS